jgi:hypothetical protein
MTKIENELFSFFVTQSRPIRKTYCALRAGFHENEKVTISGKYCGTGCVKTRFGDKYRDHKMT